MIAVIDGGSTKADWVLLDDSGMAGTYASRGVNPFLLRAPEITAQLRTDLGPAFPGTSVEAVYFYGAGCSDDKRVAVMTEGLRPLFPHADIQVEHDLLAAARAGAGKEPGIACILGTGSNSCLYDGEHILDNVTSLGYLIGDEGSGSHLGKHLLRAYFYREMPADMRAAFEADHVRDKSAVMDRIYGDHPNVYLASLAPFLMTHIGHPFAQELVTECFRAFLRRHVRKYAGADRLPVHFIGSIAYHFRDLLLPVLKEEGFQAGRILHKPIDGLVAFHTPSVQP